MKHLKVFEAYGRPDYMEMEFSEKNRNRYNVDLENFPKEIDRPSSEVSAEDSAELKGLGFSDMVEINDYWMRDLTLRYDVNAYKDSDGISDIDIDLKAVIINGTYMVWNEERDEEDEFDFTIEDFGPFDDRVEIEVHRLPFYPTGLTVSMGRSFDPKKFKYAIQLGE